MFHLLRANISGGKFANRPFVDITLLDWIS